jgi:hypothetical protein
LLLCYFMHNWKRAGHAFARVNGQNTDRFSRFFFFFYFYFFFASLSFLLRQQTQHGRHQKREFFRVGSMTALNNDWCHSVIKGRIRVTRPKHQNTNTHTSTAI